LGQDGELLFNGQFRVKISAHHFVRHDDWINVGVGILFIFPVSESRKMLSTFLFCFVLLKCSYRSIDNLPANDAKGPHIRLFAVLHFVVREKKKNKRKMVIFFFYFFLGETFGAHPVRKNSILSTTSQMPK
jgi:hypothetical protein